MVDKLKREEREEIKHSQEFESYKGHNEDIKAFQKVEGMNSVDKEDEAEAIFEKMMVARSKGAQ